MRVMILGGTKFLGVHLTGALLARGHDVTHFNRGQTAPEGRDGVTTLRGDRTAGFAGLERERFDAVIDTSGYFPGVVEAAAAFFEERAARYVFISSVSVYVDEDRAPDEESSVKALPEGASLTEMPAGYETYGALKALCEGVVTQRFGDRATILRPGLIVGPLDPTDRFTYWPVRFARGGDVLMPGPPERPVQFVDARDVAGFAVRTIEEHVAGRFNVTSPRGRVKMCDVELACARASGAPYSARYASDEFLSENGVVPWTGLPLWIPATEVTGLMNVDVGRASAAGLRIRPLAETVGDTLAWGRDRRGANWLAPEREAELIAFLRERPELRSTTP